MARTHNTRALRPLTPTTVGSVTDDNTGLVWQQTPENDRLQYADAIA
ncbi:hypothetical protein [Pseudooceanicola sp.]|nr:hypothetical protein [Pseudooceanicola sp.]MDF1855843.1 hypothetical protein [Pseudooceanicola sp.]